MIFRKFSICWNLENSLSMPSQWRPTAWWSFFRYSLRPTWITVDLWTAKWTLHSFIFHLVLVCYFTKLSVNRFHWDCLKVPLSLTLRKIMNSYYPIFLLVFLKLRITLTRKYQEHAIPTCILLKAFAYICFQRFSALISFSFLKMRNM